MTLLQFLIVFIMIRKDLRYLGCLVFLLQPEDKHFLVPGTQEMLSEVLSK